MSNLKNKITAFLEKESKNTSETEALLAYCMVDIKEDGYVHLSPTPSCSNWIAIPEKLVADITPLQEIQ